MSAQHIHLPRALMTRGEVAALCGCSTDSVERWVATRQLDSVRSSWLKESRFDRHVVDRLLRARLDGERAPAARRALVRLAYGQLKLDRGKLVDTGVRGSD